MGPTRVFAPDDFAAYGARVRDAFLECQAELEAGATPEYPYPVADCAFWPWWGHCRDRRRADDHLSLVANLQRRQGILLEAVGTHTVLALAELDESVSVPRLSKDTLANLRAQADLQLRSRGLHTPLYELLEPAPDRGLARLPAPSVGDLHFDFEGDPNWGEDGLEYLFGTVFDEPDGSPAYYSLWATTRAEEKLALETWMDWISARLGRILSCTSTTTTRMSPRPSKRSLPGTPLGRPSSTRCCAARCSSISTGSLQAVRVGVESYGLKGIEAVYDFARNPALHDAVGSLMRWQEFLETEDREYRLIALYNEDDCLSTRALAGWLRERRAEAEQVLRHHQ